MTPRRLAPLLLLLAACHPVDTASRWTVADSAGVEVVTNVGDPSTWRLSEKPLFSLGTVNGEGPTQFYQVNDIAFLPDGGFVVANQGSEQLRFFSAEGRFRFSVGYPGNGPKEFKGLAMVELYGDSLLTYDGGNDRISVRTLEGSFARSFRLEWSSGIPPLTVLLLGARGVVSIAVRPMSQLNHSGLNVDTVLVSHYDIEGRFVDSIQRLPYVSRVVHLEGNVQTTLPFPFHVSGRMVGVARGFCHVWGPEPLIRCFDLHGRLYRVIHAPLPVRPVTEADISWYWDEKISQARGLMAEHQRRSRSWMVFPDAFPAFATLLGDDQGRVWGQVYPLPHAEERRWLVFEDGRAVGELRVPKPFNVLDVRGDRVVGVWMDDMGVEFVRVYRLRES